MLFLTKTFFFKNIKVYSQCEPELFRSLISHICILLNYDHGLISLKTKRYFRGLPATRTPLLVISLLHAWLITRDAARGGAFGVGVCVADP